MLSRVNVGFGFVSPLFARWVVGFCRLCKAKWTGYSHRCKGYSEAKEMSPDEWNKVSNVDVLNMAALSGPGLEKWNHFFTRSNMHAGAGSRINRRIDIVLERAILLVWTHKYERKQREADAAGGAEQEDSKEEGALEKKEADTSQFEVETLEEAYDNNVCTFNVTARNFWRQRWYHCESCGLTGSRGVCLPCARVCHRGHILSEVTLANAYCDCGSGAAINAPGQPNGLAASTCQIVLANSPMELVGPAKLEIRSQLMRFLRRRIDHSKLNLSSSSTRNLDFLSQKPSSDSLSFLGKPSAEEVKRIVVHTPRGTLLQLLGEELPHAGDSGASLLQLLSALVVLEKAHAVCSYAAIHCYFIGDQHQSSLFEFKVGELERLAEHLYDVTDLVTRPKDMDWSSMGRYALLRCFSMTQRFRFPCLIMTGWKMRL